MNDRRILYINLALAAGLLLIIPAFVRVTTLELQVLRAERQGRGAEVPRPPKARRATETQVERYDLSGMGSLAEMQGPAQAARQTERGIEAFPDAAGSNGPAARWLEVQPAERKLFIEHIDKEIEKHENMLKEAQPDPKAQGALAIMRGLKQIAEKDFAVAKSER